MSYAPTADQPVAVDARLELLRAARHHVEVAVEDDGWAALRRRTHLRHQHRQAVVIVMVRFDVA